jgi:hypothetical protein
MILLVLFSILLLPSSFVQAQSVPAPAQPPDLTGAWRLNAELSERPPADGSALPGPQGRRGRSGAGGRRRPDSFDYGSGPRRRDLERMAAIRRLALEPPARLTIVRTGDAYVVTTEDGRVTRLMPDGKKIKSTLDNLDVEITAQWEGAQLVVKQKLEGGTTVIHQYSRFENPKQLIVITRIEHDRSDTQPRAITRVYEPAG